MTAEPKAQAGGKGIADNWGAKDIDEIVENMSKEELDEIEKLPSAFLGAYNGDKIPNISLELLYKTQCRLVQRLGMILRGASGRSGV